MFYELKRRALRSSLQILAEHAYKLYIGGRLPPDLCGGEVWPDEFPLTPVAPYMSSPLRQLSVRIPRALHRSIRSWAVEAEISDQEMAAKVFDWYVRKDLLPPYRNTAKRDSRGQLVIEEPQLVDRFRGYTSDQVMEAFEIMVDRQNRFGGHLGSERWRREHPEEVGKVSPDEATYYWHIQRDGTTEHSHHRERARRKKPHRGNRRRKIRRDR